MNKEFNSRASIAIINGNLSVQENLVMISEYDQLTARPYKLAGRDEVDSGREGMGNPRHAACVCLGKTLTSSP